MKKTKTDNPAYGNFMPCPYVPEGVDCRKRETAAGNWTCDRCGFNPAEKKRRLTEMFDENTASVCCMFSEILRNQYEDDLKARRERSRRR